MTDLVPRALPPCFICGQRHMDHPQETCAMYQPGDPDFDAQGAGDD
jgi:hypothetical protein